MRSKEGCGGMTVDPTKKENGLLKGHHKGRTPIRPLSERGENK